MIRLLFISVLLTFKIWGESAYPVDLSFLVADLKYSQEHGVKICEVQQGIVSNFKGEAFANGGVSVVANNLMDVFALYLKDGWTIKRNHCDASIKKLLEAHNSWHLCSNESAIYNDPYFLELASEDIYDPCNLFDYHGFVYLKCRSVKKMDGLHEKYPGIVFIDRATAPYWVDKAKVSKLFDLDPRLQEIKPRYGIYKTGYTSQLAGQIINDLQTKYYVIKPKGSFLGKGVIIVSENDLDSTLKYIFCKSNKLKNDQDGSYNYWYTCNAKEFIVEQFYPSDPLKVKHLGDKPYQPTMRVSYVFAFSEGEVTLHFLGAHWLLPKKSLSEKGSLNDLHKGYCVIPHYVTVDPDLLEQVLIELEEPMKLLYQKMLENK